ncbi:hypothetical protein [Phenylobacterium sp.]
MEPFSLAILFGSIVSIIVWSYLDGQKNGREVRRHGDKGDRAG